MVTNLATHSCPTPGVSIRGAVDFGRVVESFAREPVIIVLLEDPLFLMREIQWHETGLLVGTGLQSVLNISAASSG